MQGIPFSFQFPSTLFCAWSKHGYKWLKLELVWYLNNGKSFQYGWMELNRIIELSVCNDQKRPLHLSLLFRCKEQSFSIRRFWAVQNELLNQLIIHQCSVLCTTDYSPRPCSSERLGWRARTMYGNRFWNGKGRMPGKHLRKEIKGFWSRYHDMLCVWLIP